MNIPRPLKLVYVEWDDAATRSCWMEHAELDAYREASWLVRQTGFLLEDTPRHLLLAASWTPEDDWHHERFGDVTRIPKTWIKTQRVLLTVTDDGRFRRKS